MLILHPEIRKTNSLNEWDTALYTPPRTVSMQEHHQIEQRLDSWANNLAVGVALTAQYNILSNYLHV